MVDLRNKNCVVVGAGASGLAAVSLLASRGARVTLNDRRTRAELGAGAEEAESRGAELVLEAHDPALFATADLVVVSPGVPPLAVLDETEARGVEVIGEVELASRFLEGTLVGITGTNGKSTVTTLVGEMLRRSGFSTFVGGNIGVALSDAVGGEADGPDGRIVVELSSFQLERVGEFRPKVAALLNVSPDHLDRYVDYEAYARAKANVFGAQREDDHAVLCADASCRRHAPEGGPTVHEFAGTDGEVRVEGDRLVDTETGWTFPVAELRMPGLHNRDNACAAALTARLAGATPDAIAAALREVEGLSHRAQMIRNLDGVRYIDDSKATNVGAAVAALDGLATPERRAVLIAGGVDKGGSYAPLAARLAEIGRAVVLIGEASAVIEPALGGLGLPVERAEDLADAVAKARALALPGDVVLLAPACSSFDMFRSYAHRGDVFQDAVRALPGSGGDA